MDIDKTFGKLVDFLGKFLLKHGDIFFKRVLLGLFIIATIFFIVPSALWGLVENYQELFKIYIISAGRLFLIASLLLIIYLEHKQECLEQDTLGEFLERRYSSTNPNNRHPKGDKSLGNNTSTKTFTRHDFVKYIYEGKDINSSSPEYKKRGRILRKAVADERITVKCKDKNGNILYKII